MAINPNSPEQKSKLTIGAILTAVTCSLLMLGGLAISQTSSTQQVFWSGSKMYYPQSSFNAQYAIAQAAYPTAYSSLTGTPTIPAAQINSDWNSSSGVSQILNKPTLATVATTGSYTDLTNKPSGRSFTTNPSRTIVTTAAAANGTQLDAARDVQVNYSINLSSTATIGGSSTATVVLETCATNSATATDWTIIARVSNGQTISLAVALQSVQTATLNITRVIPAGNYFRLRSILTGTSSATIDSGQEIKM